MFLDKIDIDICINNNDVNIRSVCKLVSISATSSSLQYLLHKASLVHLPLIDLLLDGAACN